MSVKDDLITYYRSTVTAPYVKEVMDRLDKEEKTPKRLCIHCNRTKPITEFYQYGDKFSKYCKDCLHNTSKRTLKK